MSISCRVSLGAALLAGTLALGLTSGAAAQDGDDDSAFEVGGPCAALAYMNQGQLAAFVGAAYSDDFHSFCYPEEPMECAEYTSFLKGHGKLATGDDGYHCRLVLD